MSIDPGQRDEIDQQAIQSMNLLYHYINTRNYAALEGLVGVAGFLEHRGARGPDGDRVSGKEFAEQRARTLTIMPDVHVHVLGMWPLARTELPTVLSYVEISGTLTGRWGILAGDGVPITVGALSWTKFDASGAHIVEHREYQGQDEVAVAHGLFVELLGAPKGQIQDSQAQVDFASSVLQATHSDR